MVAQTSPSHPSHVMWSSRMMFILAAAGSAVGLGNIWRFPYVAGENGGGAFVLVYLLCIAVIGIPIMSAEILLGRSGRQSPINTMRILVAKSKANPFWQSIGWMGASAGFIILSFYGVIAGWAMYYVGLMASGAFTGADAEFASKSFSDLTGDPAKVVFWQSFFMVLTVAITARGVTNGIEKAVKILMPALFILLMVLVGYATTTGHFLEGLSFLFRPDFDALTFDGVLIAMGQGFFTLSLGMAAIMTYGAYMPKDASIVGTATTVALVDTAVALLSAIVIFPLVFANGLEISQGPGLMFVTLPLAFGQMEAGQIFGCVFFVLVVFAAITSSISLVEPSCAWLEEKFSMGRAKSAMIVGGAAWFVGLGSAFSFNIWSDVTILSGQNIFGTLDYISNNILLPLGGMLIALFAGWILDKKIVADELALSELGLKMWQLLVRFVAPIAVSIVFVLSFID